jgi:hypothetical protein
MKQDSRKRRPQQHHVFVFRHCARSTGSIVKLQPFPHPLVNSTTKKGSDTSNTEQAAQEQYLYNASDFTASPLPLWNTPDMWCTEGGMAVMKETGKFLWNNKINVIPTSDLDNDTLRIKFQFITDTSQRDVDTSFALAEGLSEAAITSAAASDESIVIDGLDDIVYDPVLFSPLENNTHWQSSRSTSTGAPLCKTVFTHDQLNHDIDLRYQQAPAPVPGLVATLKLLRDLGGVGPMGPPAENEEHEVGYEKYVNVVKIFAQMMFYSRASGIQPPFLPNATRDEVYRLLDWVDWSRSVLYIDNVESVTNGAVLAQAVLEVLETGHYNGGSARSDHLDDGAIRENEDDYDIRITIIVGHDGNQNTLASALGVRWQLPAPYQSRLQDSATPPGSALHFSHDVDSGSLEMSFLYPVFGTDWALNQTSAMGSVPLLLVDSSSDKVLSNAVKVDNNAGATEIGASDDGRSGVQRLREHLFSILREYPGAMECYDAAVSRTVSSSSPMIHVDSNANKINWLIAGTLIGNALSCVSSLQERRGRRRRRSIA